MYGLAYGADLLPALPPILWMYIKTNTPILRRAGVVWTTDRTILKIYSELVEISSAIVEISSELVEISSETFSTIAELLIISTFKNTTKTV